MATPSLKFCQALNMGLCQAPCFMASSSGMFCQDSHALSDQVLPTSPAPYQADMISQVHGASSRSQDQQSLQKPEKGRRMCVCKNVVVMCRCVLFVVCLHCVCVCCECYCVLSCVRFTCVGECACALFWYASLLATSQPRRAFLFMACAGRQGLRLPSQGKRMHPQCV